jgi:predicted ATP-grasp superfamily ATP-dependent carboligase
VASISTIRKKTPFSRNGPARPAKNYRVCGLFVYEHRCMAALVMNAGRRNDAGMADPSHGSRPLRVLLSEGSSTSAREAITVLGLAGHIVEVCDPSPVCLGRFSRFVSKLHRCPGLRDDPAGYLSFVEKLLVERPFDVLLPTHEQGFLFARVKERLEDRVGLALPSFEGYRAAHSKAGFSRLLVELGLPQPATRIVTSPSELREAVRFPCVVKTSIGTASRGIWFVRDQAALTQALQELGASEAFADEVLVQDLIAGATEKAQAIFSRGELLGFHAYRQIAAGAGGGEAIKQSVRRPGVCADVATIGTRLGWHGALSVDIIMPERGSHLFIDCNPRLVEPMSAFLAGLDLVDLLLRVSQGQTPEPATDSREGVRTHLAMQVLLGSAARGTRRGTFRECVDIIAGRGPYAGSIEELTPVRRDWISAVPLAMIALALLADPRLAGTLSKKGWGAHLLGATSIRVIEAGKFP